MVVKEEILHLPDFHRSQTKEFQITPIRRLNVATPKKLLENLRNNISATVVVSKICSNFIQNPLNKTIQMCLGQPQFTLSLAMSLW